MVSKDRPTVREITDALHRLHRSGMGRDGWAFFEELRIGTGFRRDSAQQIDAFAISLWPSKGWGSYAYEIKISRGDFRKEVQSPLKRRAALRFSNLFWFATPEGLVRPEEVPIECGLMEIRWKVIQTYPGRVEGWGAVVVVPAPWRDVPGPTWNLFASVARRVQAEETEREQG